MDKELSELADAVADVLSERGATQIAIHPISETNNVIGAIAANGRALSLTVAYTE